MPAKIEIESVCEREREIESRSERAREAGSWRGSAAGGRDGSLQLLLV